MAEAPHTALNGIVHAYDGSILYRPVYNEGSEFERFAQELHGPEIEDWLSVNGYAETRQTIKPVRLSPAYGSMSPTYNSLIRQPFDQAFVSTTHSVDAFDRHLESFVVILNSTYGTGHAEVQLQDGDYFVQLAKSEKAIAKAEPFKIDDIAAKQLIKDVLLQAGHDPRTISENATIESLLGELRAKSTKTKLERQVDSQWDGLQDKGYESEVNFLQRTVFEPRKLPTRIAEIGLSSVFSLDTTTPSGEYQPFAVTRLHFTSGPKTTKATLQAGLGNITPKHYSNKDRERLLVGTYDQLGRAHAFTGRLTSALARLATLDHSDFDFL